MREYELSKAKSALNELNALDELNNEQRADMDRLTREVENLEIEHRAHIMAGGDDALALETRTDTPDRETRERLELRETASLGRYLIAAGSGRLPNGRELELMQAANVPDGTIPLELFDVPRREQRADTLAPLTGTGVNLDPILPAIFARAVVPRLGVDMPRVESGGYSTMTITQSVTAAATAAGVAFTPTAGTLTPKNTDPHRVTAGLSLRIEDIARVGQANFESILRQNTTLAMSAQLDALGLNGDNVAPNPQGLYPQLTATDPVPSDVADWEDFVSAMASGIDSGPWAESLAEVRYVVNNDAMVLAETTFQVGGGNQATAGEMSAAAYLRAQSAGFYSSSRMPDTASTIAGGIIFRAGTMGLDGVNAMRTAVCPVWDYIEIDDIYSDAGSGIRHYFMHSLIGDVLITQTDAYSRADLKVA